MGGIVLSPHFCRKFHVVLHSHVYQIRGCSYDAASSSGHSRQDQFLIKRRALSSSLQRLLSHLTNNWTRYILCDANYYPGCWCKFQKFTSYKPKRIVEYVSWRSKDAVSPVYNAKIPCCLIICTVSFVADNFPSCWVCKWTCGAMQTLLHSVVYFW